jgi:hypothetical protein
MQRFELVVGKVCRVGQMLQSGNKLMRKVEYVQIGQEEKQRLVDQRVIR